MRVVKMLAQESAKAQRAFASLVPVLISVAREIAETDMHEEYNLCGARGAVEQSAFSFYSLKPVA